LVGPKIVASWSDVSVGAEIATLKDAFGADCDELYVRSLVRGHGPTQSAGLLAKGPEGWRVADAALVDVFR
jgi:hypothetical protein